MPRPPLPSISLMVFGWQGNMHVAPFLVADRAPAEGAYPSSHLLHRLRKHALRLSGILYRFTSWPLPELTIALRMPPGRGRRGGQMVSGAVLAALVRRGATWEKLSRNRRLAQAGRMLFRHRSRSTYRSLSQGIHALVIAGRQAR